MEEYIKEQQYINGWYDVSNAVISCCIQNKSTKGFCLTCMDNFRYRNGYYYEGFEYPDDDELLERIAAGKNHLVHFPDINVINSLKKILKGCVYI